MICFVLLYYMGRFKTLQHRDCGAISAFRISQAVERHSIGCGIGRKFVPKMTTFVWKLLKRRMVSIFWWTLYTCRQMFNNNVYSVHLIARLYLYFAQWSKVVTSFWRLITNTRLPKLFCNVNCHTTYILQVDFFTDILFL